MALTSTTGRRNEGPAPAWSNLRSVVALPIVRQLALLIGLAAAIAGGISLYFWAQEPGYTPLYGNLSEKDAADVADALRAANVDYRLDAATGRVLVAPGKVHEARLQLASQGLPKGTALGMEMIQQEQGFGTSQFIEVARYQLALETELARTVSSLMAVKNARVHLALPKASAFSRNRESASASVLVELYPGRRLEAGQVASIVHIVASSVPSLPTSAVMVSDQHGNLLTAEESNSELARSGEQFGYRQKIEADYVRRIEQLLTPMMGPGRVSAQVTADVDFSVTEEVREAYSPNPGAVRSEQTAEELSPGIAGAAGAGGALAAAQGVPGATSNQPPDASQAVPLQAGAAAAPAAAVAQSRNSTRNYELDKTVSHTRKGAGRVQRLSVAVLVDNLPQTDSSGAVTSVPLKPEQLAAVEALVREAVGFDAQRGDSMSVQNAAFLRDERPLEVEPLPLWQQPVVRDVARQGLGALVLLVLLFAVLRPLLRSLLNPQRPTERSLADAMAFEALTAEPATHAQESSTTAADAPMTAPKAYEQKLGLARNAVAQDPKRVAQVVKTWIGAEA